MHSRSVSPAAARRSKGSLANLIPADQQSIYQAFAISAERHASLLALVSSDARLSYQDLLESAAGFHSLLETTKSVAGKGVGVMLGRPERQIAAILGVLRAGAFYVFLDAELPEARLRDILEDGAVSIILTDSENFELAAAVAPDNLPMAVLKDVLPAGSLSPVAVNAGDLAYIAYTSGTGGKPKGVMHEHANVLHEAAVHRQTLDIGPDDRSTMLYSPGVTGSVRDVFGTLLAGARLCPFQFKRRGFHALKHWIHREGVTLFHSVPNIFRELMRTMEPGERLKSIRTVFVAGERVLPDDFRIFRQRFSAAARFYTGIGATETSSIYTHWFVNKIEPWPDNRLPCGTPVPDKEVYLVGKDRQSVAAGQNGEIAVRSRYLARGYWGHPELTTTSFGHSDDGSGRRVYYTGDYGFFDSHGRLVHLGRRDRQFKINGQRIELGEIENALRSQPEIQSAAIRVVGDSTAIRPRIVAYVVSPLTLDERELRNRLSLRLPSAAIPTDIVRLDQLPLSGNGKIDYQALPLPSVVATRRNEFSRDCTLEERQILSVWRAVLPGLPVYNLHDTFDSLGGDSLQAIRLTELLYRRFKLDVSGALFIRSATVADLAMRLRSLDPAIGKLAGEIARLDTLAEIWKLNTQARKVSDDCPVYVAGAQRPGVPVLWFGQAGAGLEIGLELALYRPVYLIPSASAVSAGEMEMLSRHIANLLHPHLPGTVICGGCCYSGLQAMVLAAELKRSGQKVDGLLLLDAFGSRWSRWLTFRFFNAQYQLRSLRSWPRRKSLRYLLGETRRKSAELVSRAIRLVPQEACPPHPYLIDFEPFGYGGEILHILSSKTAWLRRVMPRMGWGCVESANAEVHVVEGDHDGLWQGPGLCNVTTILQSLLGRYDQRNVPEPPAGSADGRATQPCNAARKTLESVSDTARWVAAYRAQESRRQDAIFVDPLAERLAGKEGERIITNLAAGWMASSIVVRTAVLDEFIGEMVAAGIDTVLNLGAGLDTRPYRLDLPQSLQWVEFDLPEIIAYKNAELADAKPRCFLRRIALDLMDPPGRREAFREISATANKALVITEGLLVYLPETEVRSLAKDLLAQKTFYYWALDLVSPDVRAGLQKNWREVLEAARAEMIFAPANGADYFLSSGWNVRKVRRFSDSARKLNRVTATKPDLKPGGVETGYVLLERAGNLD